MQLNRCPDIRPWFGLVLSPPQPGPRYQPRGAGERGGNKYPEILLIVPLDLGRIRTWFFGTDHVSNTFTRRAFISTYLLSIYYLTTNLGLFLLSGSGVWLLWLFELVQEARGHLRLRRAARACGQREGQHAPLHPRSLGSKLRKVDRTSFKRGCEN